MFHARALLPLMVISVCCGTSAGTAPPASGGFVADTSLGLGDAFEVRVYGEEELSKNYQVTGEGMIDFPFVGRVEVLGKEPTAVAADIRQRLREGGFMTDPQVAVLVTDHSSKHVSVMGSVGHPGIFPLTNALTAVGAISLAGGLSALASSNAVIVSRRIDGELRRFVVRAGDVTEGRAEDLPLQAGDIVFVPQRVF